MAKTFRHNVKKFAKIVNVKVNTLKYIFLTLVFLLMLKILKVYSKYAMNILGYYSMQIIWINCDHSRFSSTTLQHF